MNDMINKIYNSEYFVIGLFILIGVLAIIFLVLVFSGKKKKNKNVSEVGLNEPVNAVDNSQSLNVVESTNTINNQVANNNIENTLQPESIPVVDNSLNNVNITENVSAINLGSVEGQIDSMSFTSEVNPAVNEPVAFASTVENVVPNPIENVNVESVEQENMFNTSIFRELPEELKNSVPASENVQPVVEETNNGITSDLFEPAPDFSQINVDVPVENSFDSNVNIELPQITPVENQFVAPEINEPAINQAIASEQVVEENVVNSVVEPITMPSFESVLPTIEQQKEQNTSYQERVAMPTQFSSVYINKPDVTPVEQPSVTVDNSKPAYDPTLFAKYDPVPEIKPVMPENFVAPTVNNEPSVTAPIVNEPIVNETPVVESAPIVEPIPELEPMKDANFSTFDLEKTMEINTSNTFNFDLPSLASNQEEVTVAQNPVETTTSNENATASSTNNSFPSFISETYDIK